MQAVDENEAVFQRLRKRLIQTGEWERLKATLVAVLDKSGWSGEVQQNCREKASEALPQRIPLADIQIFMETQSHRLLKPEIRGEITAILRESIQKMYES
ncbi:hypothetical protein CYLTODRAFT_419494 [Cylindrobasidium torrendii FP15055 ss-10]|uniref:Transcription and mRNA export factor SUS1 n=1 Tax=Cylindrobasidium torrendii FP15055 ss-10 TaxID=1314674 RepID=A0A0D7BJG3_9AGAR|nr:hypothetical protein CYLTODRAFT_419494 [Cylindrobasidium torrendii FP15055 ss-10]